MILPVTTYGSMLEAGRSRAHPSGGACCPRRPSGRTPRCAPPACPVGDAPREGLVRGGLVRTRQAALVVLAH